MIVISHAVAEVEQVMAAYGFMGLKLEAMKKGCSQSGSGAKYCAYIFSTSPTTTLIQEVYGGEEEVDDSTFAYDSDDAAPVKRVAEYLALNRRKRKAEDNRIEQLQMELEECKNREQQEGASKLSTQASSCRPPPTVCSFWWKQWWPSTEAGKTSA
ncbi:hypothetical protein Vretifemale_20727 [Volvox reticuliferus]|uniref:Uncharacterized protein n=1 Tax=Volvox reticuliferus TaxID=1737510 RepID=A0A8J4D1Q6_9CHLO|nr:hypothetical protein Vretifemale_20727 [Volvox reticuliferus]